MSYNVHVIDDSKTLKKLLLSNCTSKTCSLELNFKQKKIFIKNVLNVSLSISVVYPHNLKKILFSQIPYNI